MRYNVSYLSILLNPLFSKKTKFYIAMALKDDFVELLIWTNYVVNVRIKH
jgi:hypothetical protein